MPIGTSDGEYFEDRWEYTVRKPVIDPTTTPEFMTNDQNVVTPNQVENNRQLDKSEQDPTTGTGIPIGLKRVPITGGTIDSTMPLEGSTEPAGAFKSGEGGQVPGNDDVIRPEPFGLNPPERGPGFPRPDRGDPTILYKTKTGIEITDHDIDDAVEMGSNFGVGSIKAKDPWVQTTIKDAHGKDWFLNSKGKWEEVRADSLEQVPFGYSEGEWAQMSPYQKKKVLDNPPSGGLPVTGKDWDWEWNGHKINSSKLSDKQYKDLQQTIDDYNKGSLSLAEVKDELKEYEKFTRPGGTKDQMSGTDKVMAEIAKVLDDLEKVGSSLPKKPSKWFKEDGSPNIPEKLSPKEAFKQGFQQAKDQLADDLNLIAAKFKKAIAGPPPEIPPPKISGKGDYTEPAYRGLSIYDQPGMMTNPVYKFSEEGAMYSTAHPQLADMYAGYLNTHPGIKVPPGTFPDGAQVMPLLINPKEYHYFDAKGEIWQKANPKAINQAKDMGKKGVIVDNVWDEPNSTKSLAKPNKIYITFPQGAGTVKSRFAEKFDPNDPNILHGIGTIGIGTAATGFISSDPQE